jgi:hypothetical protein
MLFIYVFALFQFLLFFSNTFGLLAFCIYDQRIKGSRAYQKSLNASCQSDCRAGASDYITLYVTVKRLQGS